MGKINNMKYSNILFIALFIACAHFTNSLTYNERFMNMRGEHEGEHHLEGHHEGLRERLSHHEPMRQNEGHRQHEEEHHEEHRMRPRHLPAFGLPRIHPRRIDDMGVVPFSNLRHAKRHVDLPRPQESSGIIGTLIKFLLFQYLFGNDVNDNDTTQVEVPILLTLI